MNAYLASVLENVKKKHGGEPEFVQTVEEVFSSIEPVIDAHPEYEKFDILNRMVEPERMFTFRVCWMDDNGQWHTNIGYRCQFNGAIGPYKGGLRFQANVTPSIIKFLGFEQTYKNSLTGLPMGGAKGGSDFDPAGKSDAEIMRFCQAFMSALYRYIGPDIDVPAGDMGVGGREIGYLFGQYRRLKGVWENGVLTGKGMSYGGSLIRPEATGYGAVYYLQEVLKHEGEDIKGKTIAISGFGNVAWGICQKALHLGAKVVTLSGPDGYIYDPDGVSSSQEKVDYMLEMRASGRNRVQDYADKFGVQFFPGEKPWGVKADIIMPAAMQNDVKMESAEKIVANGIKYYIEVANMPTTNDALAYLMKSGLIVAPSKAVNAGGVGVSGLEMSQNSERLSWTAEEVDEKLHQMMVNIHNASAEAAAEYGLGYNLVAGANIAGFKKVATAMMEQGAF
ncbi:MAG: NADP-specific glutamate dehydrogenase [Oscillospiraceae bacterium]|nr:NADP-specific glutamate dehydrogenase [Oscillospiraceae bacterium]